MTPSNITYFLRDDGACAYYRADLPFSVLSKKTPFQTYKIEQGDSQEHIAKGLDGADTVFIPRIIDKPMIELAKELKKEGKKVVTDLDDNVFSINPFSQAYKVYGTEEQMVNINGEELPLWIDGKNIDIAENKKRIALVKEGMKVADIVTTTTEKLARVFRKINKKVKVLPNCLDFDLWKPLDLNRKDKDEIRLMWAGGSSHYHDWLMVSKAVTEIMKKYSNVKLVILGEKFDGTLKDIPPHRIEYHGWVPTPAYPYKMAQLDADIALIPLAKDLFNECKSNLKWLEFSALQVPCVASHVLPYSENATDDNGVWIEDNNIDAWVEGLSLLIEDKVLRAKIAGQAHRDVFDKFNIENQYQQWAEVYGGLQ